MGRTRLALVVVVVAAAVGAGTTAVMATDGSSDAAAADHVEQGSNDTDERTISVSAAGSAQASADQAVVRVSVVAVGPDAPTVRDRLAANASELRAALAELGVADDRVRTERYDLNRDRRPPRREAGKGEPVYRGTHTFRVTVTDLDRVGEVVDAAVAAGADNVEEVRYTLSEERRRQLRQEALRTAMDNARGQAETLADAAGLTVTGVKRVDAQQGHGPVPYRVEAGSGAAPTTNVEGGPVGVSAQVSVVYTVAST